MQRLRIDARDTNGELWIEPDPEGEFVRAEEAVEANALLAENRAIVAKMLAALKSALECIEAFAGEGPTYRKVKAAIAAAEPAETL